MGFFASTYQWFGQTFRLTDVEPWKVYAKNMGVVAGGAPIRPVTVEGAMALTVVFACMRLLADTIANLPVDVYQRVGKEKRERPDHAVAQIFGVTPNDYMTPRQFKRAMQLDLEGWGNAFARIQRSDVLAGRPVIGLLPLRAYGMRLVFEGQSVWPTGYEHTDERGRRTSYRLDEILHLRGLGNGLWGLSPIASCRLSVAGALAAEDYSARMYAKGMRRAGWLQVDQLLKEPQREQIRKNIMEPMEQPERLISLLEAGMKFESMSLSPEEAQFIETQKWRATDIGRMFGVPPHMFGELDRATFSNIEEQGIDFARYTIAGRVGEWEDECRRKLFAPEEQRTHYLKFNLDWLLRGNTMARANFYNTMTRAGIMTVNEAREKEDMAPKEGGDELRVQAQMTPLDQAGQQPPQQNQRQQQQQQRGRHKQEQMPDDEQMPGGGPMMDE